MRQIITLLYILLSIHSYGQTTTKKNYFPIWSFHQEWTFDKDEINIHGISLGLWSYNGEPRYTDTNGIKLELIGPGIILPMMPSNPIAQNDVEYKVLKEKPISETINGINLSTTGSFCNCITNGLATGGIMQVHFQVNGISFTPFFNLTQKHNGLMLSFTGNITYSTNGVQLAGLSNTSYRTKGLQISIVNNVSDKMNGVQIGLFNKSKKLRGIQIGLWNVNQKRTLPFINWNFSKD